MTRSCCVLNHTKEIEPDVVCCVYCGTVFFSVAVVSVEHRVEQSKPAYDDRTKTMIYDVVRRHYDFITELLTSQISWEVITRRLKERARVGKLEVVKVQKYYLYVGERNGTQKSLPETEDR